MTIGKRISKLRREKKFSQELLAEKLGVSRQAVSKWENDLTAPDTNNLVALAVLLGVSVEFLATGNEPEVQTKVMYVQKPFDPEPLYRLSVKLFITVFFMNIFGFLFGILNEMVVIPVTDYSGFYIPVFYDYRDSTIGIIYVVIEVIILIAVIILSILGKILGKSNSK